MSLKQAFYNSSPYFLQHLLLNLYALRIHRERYGKQFDKALKELEETQNYSTSEIEAYQNLHLRRLIEHAYNTVPFYKERFAKTKLTPSDIRSVGDLSKIPLLTRKELLNNKELLLSRMVCSSDLVYGHTSGTTGSPLTIGWDKETCIFTNAVDWRQKSWAGVSVGDPIALFLGRPVVSLKANKPPFWQLDRIHNQLWMSSFHMSQEHLPSYVEKIKSSEVVAIEGYPSTIYILARFLQATNQRLKMCAVFTSSEVLHQHQRDLIEEVFSCKVFDFYGMAERMVFATQCQNGPGYHLNFEYAVNEVVDDAGNPVEKGFLVGTSLRNFGMPLIRYRTSDVVEIDKTPCACGREMQRLKEVLGRDESILVVPGGKLISNSVLTPPFKQVGGIVESQIVQETIDKITVKLVVEDSFGDSHKLQLVDLLKERIGVAVTIEVELLDEIPRDSSGKFTWLVSKVPLSF